MDDEESFRIWREKQKRELEEYNGGDLSAPDRLGEEKPGFHDEEDDIDDYDY